MPVYRILNWNDSYSISDTISLPYRLEMNNFLKIIIIPSKIYNFN